MEGVEELTKNIKLGKSTGINNTATEMLKYAGKSGTDTLWQIFNITGKTYAIILRNC